MRRLLALLALVSSCKGNVPPEGPRPRVVSLNPGATEVLFAIGAGGNLVGRSRYDDWPQEVEKVPVVGDLVAPDVEKIAALRPDLVIVSTPMQAELAQTLVKLGLDTVDFSPEGMDELLSEMVRLGRLLGREREAKALADSLMETLPNPDFRLRVFIEIGKDPLYTAGQGSLVGEAVAKAGGENVFGGRGYFPVRMEEVLARKPAAVIVAHPGEPAPWPDEIKVIRINPDELNRPGPRLFSAIASIYRELAALIPAKGP